jgi:hypothetical protein
MEPNHLKENPTNPIFGFNTNGCLIYLRCLRIEPTLKGHLPIIRLTDNQTLHIDTQSLGIVRIKAVLSIN